MRLPTINQYKQQVNNLGKQYEYIAKLQTTAASGKKLQKASEDPSRAQRIQIIEQQMHLQKGYSLNASYAEHQNRLIYDRTQEATTLLSQTQELLIKAQNDTLGTTDRARIADQVQSNLNTLTSIVNSQDSNGEYLFSGFNVTSPPFQKDNNNQFIYNGSEEVVSIAIANNQSVVFRENGQQLFGDILNEIQNITKSLKEPSDTPEQRQQLHNALNDHSTKLDEMYNHMQMQLNTLGNRAKTIDDQIQAHANTKESETALLSQLADADMGEVLTELMQKLTAIQVTQQGYLKIQETFLSLLNRG